MKLIPLRYLPNKLTKKDKARQVRMLNKSRKMYKKGVYYSRDKVKSFKSKPSNHIKNALRIYKIDSVIPNKQLSDATGCSLSALKQIVKKGEGAYFSSGSRPNQSAQSWGLARLASSLTSGKAAAVDFDILDKGCDHNKKAFILAKKAKKKYGYGRSKTKKVAI
jgi:DNA-binding Xre family transcriptional regulator